MERIGDSNPWPSDCEPDALPAAPFARVASRISCGIDNAPDLSAVPQITTQPLAVVASRTSYGITYTMKKSVVGNTAGAVLIFMNG